MSSSKRYCFTINNPNEYEIEEVYSRLVSRCEYFIIGKEVGEEGTPHLQGYCVFKTRCGFSRAKDLISERAHLEAARGSSNHNRTYCSKGGDSREFGTCPTDHRAGGNPRNTSTRDELATSFRLALASGAGGVLEFADNNPGAYGFSGHNLLRNSLSIAEPRERAAITVEWIWGRPGVGKSRRAHEQYPGAYIKDPRTKWWNGYLLEEEVIVDDFGPNGIDINHLLRWFDRYKCNVETKGGMMPLYAFKFIVTSNFHPRAVFTDHLGAEHPQYPALERRISINEIL